MYKNYVIILFITFFIRIDAQAWPNNLLFTLEAKDEIRLEDPMPLDYEIIENSGATYIGKFKCPEEAEKARIHLGNIGIDTELKAFFRARPIDLRDAMILCRNMNSREEAVMLTQTKAASKLTPAGNENKIPVRVAAEKKTNARPAPEKPEKIHNDRKKAFFTIQLGVFSKSVKHKFYFEVKETVINGKYYCFYGNFLSVTEAKAELTKLKKKGYKDAFVTGIENDKKVSLDTVKQILDHS